MYCLDANVWIYYLDSDLPEHETVRGPVRRLLSDRPLFTTTVLQMEVVHYLHTQLAENESVIDRFLRLEDVTVADLTATDVTTAAEYLASYPDTGIGGRDATVVAAMERYGVDELWTHDEGLKRLGDRLDWLTVRDPVETDPL